MKNYLRTKNKLCLNILGHNPEYLLQLKYLRKYLEKDNVELAYCCRQEYSYWLKEDPRNTHNYNKLDYSYTIPIVYNAENEIHPIFNLIKDIKVDSVTRKEGGSLGLICTEGNYPLTSLNEEQISYFKKYILSKRLQPVIIDNSVGDRKGLAEAAGLVVGIGCDIFWEAAINGIETILLKDYSEHLYNKIIKGKVYE